MDQVKVYSFCESFIDRLTDDLLKEFVLKGKDLSRVAIVFGGRRPALFLRRALARKIKGNFFPPKFFTIDEWMSYVVRKTIAFTTPAELDNCYLLYQLAKKYAPEILKNREKFAQFLPWGFEILKFIDQLDLQMIDDHELAKVKASAAIGFDVPDDINGLLGSIGKLRAALRQDLLERKCFARGLQYRMAAENISKTSFDEFDSILFCNFFYLHESEERVLKDLYERKKAHLIFQGDERKWTVLEKTAKNFSFSIQEAKELPKPKFNLKLHCGFDIHSQVSMLSEVLKTIKNPSEAVIVLPNSDSLIPLLSEISQNVKDFNISMGYPLKRSSLYALFTLIFKSQLSRKKEKYYVKDYLALLRHPFIKNLKVRTIDECDPTVSLRAERSEATQSFKGLLRPPTGSGLSLEQTKNVEGLRRFVSRNDTEIALITRTLIHKIEEVIMGKEGVDISGNLFVDLKDMEKTPEIFSLTIQTLEEQGLKIEKNDLQKIIQTIHELVFCQWENVKTFQEFSRVLEKLLNELIENSSMNHYPLNMNIAQAILLIREEFTRSTFKDEVFPQDELFKIFESKVSGQMMSFKGSPLKGLQILGLFETRALNFENVIVLDCNEGSLPSLKVYEPLIPREVTVGLNLNRLELEEEVQRYQFLRLISSAKNVHLIYQENDEKEKSRFLEELIWEEEKKKNDIHCVAIARGAYDAKVISEPKRAKKTKEMVEFLGKMKYSASSLNMYLKNPYEFYTKYVLGLEEKEDLLDEPEARHVGTFIHEVLEDAFQPFLHKKPVIDSAFIKRFQRILDDNFEKTLSKTMKTDSFLLKAVIDERLKRFLDYEEKSPDRKVARILYLEAPFTDTIPLSHGDIQFKYIVDRVDEMEDGTIMIIDYKTGNADLMPRRLERLVKEDLTRETIRDNLRSFQIPLYFYYLNKQYPQNTINAALYSLRTVGCYRFLKEYNEGSRNLVIEKFLDSLDFIVGEILDPEVDFIEDLSTSF